MGEEKMELQVAMLRKKNGNFFLSFSQNFDMNFKI